MSPPHAAENRAFTPEQERAIRTRGISVSLSAGAGCGKTLVLTERFLSYFEPGGPDRVEPEDIAHLVAITFTDRAAREMRDRVRKKCYERLQSAPPEQAAYWVELLRALDHARISTIHSLCAALLRSRAVEAGVDPQFAVLQQAQADTLLAEAIDDELRVLVSRRDEATLELAVRFDLNRLREMIRGYILGAQPEDFERWLAISPDDQVARWARVVAEFPQVLGRELAASTAAGQVREVLQANVPNNKTMRERRAVVLDTLDRLQEGPDSLADLANLLELLANAARVQGGGGAASWSNAAAYETFKQQADRLRGHARALQTWATFNAADARPAALVGRQLLAVANQARLAYDRRKAELRVMDFNDLLARTRALLADQRHRGVVAQLSAGLVLLLVDEFQDTDPLQVELVKALCGEGLTTGKLFFVGDYQQSIYRFRGADPHVFRELRREMPPKGRQSLTLNFRSQPAILRFVNALFSDDLEEYDPLLPKREQVTPEPAIEFLWAASPQGARESVEQQRTREAEWIARRICGLVDEGQPLVWDAGGSGLRKARLGDIAILFRALSDVELYESALERFGIDYYLVGGHAFYAQQEVFDLLNLLRTLNDPADPVSLVGALRSAFFSLADETIFWLAQHYGGITAGLFATQFPAAIGPEQAERAACAARTIVRLRACKDRLPVCELIELACELTGYDATLLHEFLGERKLANLLKLQEQARTLARGNFLGLADFITELAQFVARRPEEPLAATHAEDADVVRLMTVHQAKGLEFPIVIVPDLDRRGVEPGGDAHFDHELGPLVKLPARRGQAAPLSGFDVWLRREDAEDAEEAKRLLYVATTRAADCLILSAAVDAVGVAKGAWLDLVARRFNLSTGQFLGNLDDDETPPRIRVTTTEPAVTRPQTSREPRVRLDAVLADVRQAAADRQPVHRGVEPIAPDLAARRQYSFSRLSGALRRRYERLDAGVLDDATSVDPRSLGTLVHAALAALDLAAPGNVRTLVERLAEEQLPEAPDVAAEAAAMLEHFVASARARAIASAGVCHSEVEFLLAWPPDGRSGEVVLRGFLDRLYQDAAGHWHIIDFKTNLLGDRSVAAASAPYEMQMLVYGLAAERILGSPPASLTLHFLRTGDEHAFAWNDDARERAIRMVNEAIEADRRGGVAPTPREASRPRKSRQLKLDLD